MIGSPYYWAFVAAITLAFAVIDISALSQRSMGRAHGLAVAIYIATWGGRRRPFLANRPAGVAVVGLPGRSEDRRRRNVRRRSDSG